MRNDVLVIGGGPAGLAAAIAARAKGFDVTLRDTAHPPIDKACGEGILPAGIGTLRRLGVRIAESDGFPFYGIRFLAEDTSVEARFRGGFGLALRRTVLHAGLVRRAAELGVRLEWGVRAPDVAACDCRWLVGADGQNSHVRRAAGLGARSRELVRFGFRQHYRVTPWTDLVEVHWGAGCQLYVTPVSDDEIGIALLSGDQQLRLDAALRQFPKLERKVRGVPRTSTERGALSVSRRLDRVYRGRTVLIGDASGSVDAVTGDGLSLAFHQAHALAEALSAGDLRSYQASHRRLARRPAFMERLLLALDRFPSGRRIVFRMLASKPEIFAMLLAQHAIEPAGEAA